MAKIGEEYLEVVGWNFVSQTTSQKICIHFAPPLSVSTQVKKPQHGIR